jgi:acyl-homoserine-lactone acylase
MRPTSVSAHVRLGTAVVVAALVAAACSGDDGSSSATLVETLPPIVTEVDTTVPDTTVAPTTVAPTEYRASIRRTSDGVPHIVAADLASVFFGQGYASGQDHACSLADQLAKVQGRRAAALGPGDGDANIISDFAWLSIGVDRIARADYAAAPPIITEQFEAFAAGWNQHLAEVGNAGLSGWCAGADWVQPITAEDLYAYARSIALNASGARLTGYIGAAQPPGVASDESALPPLDLDNGEELASNGWAVGRDRTEGGTGGLLVANPHFPWEGELRFWESHLTVPGELDIYGANLTGLPGIGIGFTDTFAWTHTVSAGARFTAYLLSIDPADPTRYVVDGESKPMTSEEFTIQVRGDDGGLTPLTRTMWRSHHGPILDFPGVGWTAETVVTYRDANIDSNEFIEQYAAMARATNLDELIDAHRVHQGVPLFNTIAVSNDGRAWYADTSATPKLSDEAITAYREKLATDAFTQIARQSGAVLLDGSTSLYEWQDVPGARDPGLVPFDEMPMIERTDYVFNANDSFWLSNADELLEGPYSILHGDQRSARSLRTRENARLLADTGPTGLAGEDGLFSGEELRDASLANTSFSSYALLAPVVERCSGVAEVDVPNIVDGNGNPVLRGRDVDIAEACEVLAAWDGTYDLDAIGAPLWREWLARWPAAAFRDEGELFSIAFDPADPVGTPAGLAAPAVDGDLVLRRLGEAVLVLEAAGYDVDATLRDTQFAARSATRIPVHGGNGTDGVPNVVQWGGLGSSTEPVPGRGDRVAPGSSLTDEGYPISYGSSFVLTVDYTGGAPRAWALLTYSNTGDRTSPLFDAQMQRFSDKDWREVALTDAAIEADPGLVVTQVSAAR